MSSKTKSFLFILSWLVLGLVQAAFTRLTSDEGYYWFYSRQPEWGYYDHPPMIALMIKAGYSLFQNELGARLLNVLCSTASLLLFFKLLSPHLRQKTFTWLVVLSQPLLHYFAIIIFPDGPLLFFGLLYLTGYKRLLEKNDWLSALLMGLALAGMFYSKYHGVLILVFTILSNFSLLRSKWFWWSLLIPLSAAVPHLGWQFENGFPSLGYHLQGRTSGFSLKYVGEFISQQIPAAGPVFIIAAFAIRTKDRFEKTLKFIAIGTLGFFLLASFRGFVHFHWTSVAIFPMMLLAARYYDDAGRKKLFYWLGIPFLVVIVLFRIHVVHPFLPLKQKNLGYYQGRQLWAKDVEQLAGHRPVLFIQDFREAGLYSFYTGKMAVTLFGGDKRKTQYDLWDYEDSLQGKEILMLQKNEFAGSKQKQSRLGKTIYYQYRRRFESYYDIAVQVQPEEPAGDSLPIRVTIRNDRQTALHFHADPSGSRPVLFYQFENGGGTLFPAVTLKTFDENDRVEIAGTRVYHFTIPIHNLKAGEHTITVGFIYGVLPPSFNTGKKKFMVPG